MPVVTLLTDFGTRDYYVAAVKGVVLRHAPKALLTDLSHDVAPGDIEGAGFLLRAAAPEFPPGTVHLAVVDPGVGSSRRILAARAGTGFYVAPDNGLLTGIVEGAEVRSVTADHLFTDGPGQTFHGRDRFAPVAGYLSAGGELERLGPRIFDPIRIAVRGPERHPGYLAGRIVHIDRFGNLVTDIPSSWIENGFASASVGKHETSRLVGHYAELPPGEAGLLPGSLGTLELSLAGSSLAQRWGIRAGDTIRIDTGPGTTNSR